jgi:two-component system cell cycle response regulator
MQILVADDDPVSRKMLQCLAPKWGYEVIAVPDGEAAWQHLRAETGPRLAILDWTMPGMDGARVCRQLRAQVHDRYVYVLLVSARSQSADVIQGMNAGADDYVCKPFQAAELRARLRAGRRVIELQEQLLKAHEALRQQALRDGLTGLWNRVAIFDLLRAELSRASRVLGPVTVLMADVDNFKEINDRHGHLAGDEILRGVAKRMRASVRSHDAAGRYGGEKFLLILPGSELNTGYRQAERIRASIAAEQFSAGGHSLAITCSFGVACTNQPDASQADSLVKRADEALYAAKRNGRNRVEMHVPARQGDPGPLTGSQILSLT